MPTVRDVVEVMDWSGLISRHVASSSPLVAFEGPSAAISRTDLAATSNEVGILKIMQVF